MQVVVAHTVDPDPEHALAELCRDLRAGAADEPPVALMVFACIEMDHQRLLDGLVEAFPGVPLIGCTTDGEVSADLGFQEDSVCVTLFAGHDLRARAVVARDLSKDIEAALDVAERLTGPEGGPTLVFALPEGLSACGADVMVDGLNRRLPSGIPLVGGTAGDQWEFQGTRQFFGQEVLGDSMPLLGVYGDMRVSVGVSSGYAPIGTSGLVTSAQGPLVHSIDGLPATAFYRKVAGVTSGVNPENPLSVSVDGGPPFLRAPLRSDPETGAIQFAGDVPAGATVFISEVGNGELLDACQTSIQLAMDGLGGDEPHAAFIFSCAARKQLLGTRTAKEAELLSAILPSDIVMSGFYTYGEIGPQNGRIQADFHNQTFVAVLVGAPG